MNKNESPLHFGEHFMIDGYGADMEALNDRSVVEQSLVTLPEKLDMKILDGPFIAESDGNEIKDPGGWSGVIIIAESHISVHTFVDTQFVTIDVYTCKNGMNLEVIKEHFSELFSLQELECNFVKRGMRYAEALEAYRQNNDESTK